MRHYQSVLRSLFLNHKLTILTIVLAVLASTITAYVAYQHRFTINPDGIGYIAVANYYISGDWLSAINAYWSPFLSWALIPFLLLGFSGGTAFALVTALTAATILAVGCFGVYWATGKRWASLLWVIAIAPFLVRMASGSITPDGIVACWTVIFVFASAYLSRFSLNKKPVNYKKVVVLLSAFAALGALGYFIKLYLFFVWLAALPVIYFLMGYQGSVVKTLWRVAFMMLATLGLFTALISPWLYAINDKYGYITLGSSFSYNAGPSGVHPMLEETIPPPSTKATSSWEDPTYLIPYKNSSLTDTEYNQKSRIEKMVIGFPAYIASVYTLWLFMIVPVALACILFLLKRSVSYINRNRSMFIAVTVFMIYLGGYATLGNGGLHRYQWPLLPLSLLVGILLAPVLARRIGEESKVWLIAVAVAIAAVLTSLYMGMPKDIMNAQKAGQPTRAQVVAQKISNSNQIPPGSRVISNEFISSLYVSYFAGLNSYGVVTKGMMYTSNEFDLLVKRHDIEYMLYFGDTEARLNGREFVARYAFSGRYCAAYMPECNLYVYKFEQ